MIRKIKGILNSWGLSTVEVVIITAILVGLALLFREYIISFLKKILDGIFQNGESVLK